MKPKIIAIYFDSPLKMDYPFSEGVYFDAYMDFSKRARKYNLNILFVRGDSYLGDRTFSHAWQFTNTELVDVPGPVQADLIYPKGYNLKLDSSELRINSKEIDQIADDKLLTYKEFSSYMPITIELNDQNFTEALGQIKTKLVVIKPSKGMEGEGIYIGPKNKFDVNRLKRTKETFLIQEFIDSSDGINGLIDGLHDLRLLIYNGKILMSFIRKPKEGSFLANLSQGGSFIYLPIKNIPIKARNLAQHVDKRFIKYVPRFYSIDMMFSNGKPYIIELNSQPGMSYRDEEKYYKSYSRSQKYLIDVILSALK